MIRVTRKFRNLLWLVIILGTVSFLFGETIQSTLTGMLGLSDDSRPTLSLKDFDFKPAERRDIHKTVLATGTVTLKTGAEVKLGPRISGQLKKLNVEIGDFVHKNDVIAVVEHEDLTARVAQMKADLKAEQARLTKIRQEGPLEINKVKAELEELQVKFNLANKMLVRNRDLHQQGVVSQTALDESEEELEVLRAQIKLAQEDLKLKEAQLKNDINLAEVMVEKAQANLQEEETQLSYATLTAPIDGIIASVSTQEGETVAASLNAPTFVTLIDLRQLQVTVYVDETDIGQVQVKQDGAFTVDSYPDRFFKGIVREIYPKAVIKDNVVNYEVILEIEKKGLELLRPEMTANVVITTDTRNNVVTIPKEALKRDGKKKFVVMKGDDIVISREVETGWREGGWQEILSGVNEGDEVGIPIKPEASERRGGRPRRG